MALRVEFDRANKILLLHFEGQLRDDSIAEFYRAIRKYWTTTGASMGIVEFSSITEFALSGNLVVKLAQQEPCIPDGTSRSRVIVAPKTRVFYLAHAFQILVEKHGRS